MAGILPGTFCSLEGVTMFPGDSGTVVAPDPAVGATGRPILGWSTGGRDGSGLS